MHQFFLIVKVPFANHAKIHVTGLSISNPLSVLSVRLYWLIKHCDLQWNPFRNTIFYIGTLVLQCELNYCILPFGIYLLRQSV